MRRLASKATLACAGRPLFRENLKAFRRTESVLAVVWACGRSYSRTCTPGVKSRYHLSRPFFAITSLSLRIAAISATFLQLSVDTNSSHTCTTP